MTRKGARSPSFRAKREAIQIVASPGTLLRLSAAEQAVVQRAATAAGLPLALWVRLVVLETALAAEPDKPVLPEIATAVQRIRGQMKMSKAKRTGNVEGSTELG